MKRISLGACLFRTAFMLMLSTCVFEAAAKTNPTTLVADSLDIKKYSFLPTAAGEALSGWKHTDSPVGDGGYWDSSAVTILAIDTGLVYNEDGRTYSIYQIPGVGSEGVGVVMNVQERRRCLVDESTDVVAMQGNNKRYMRRGGFACSSHFLFNVKYVATGQNITQGVSIPPFQLGIASLGIDNEAINMSAFEMTYEKVGCTASVSPSTVSMGVVSPLRFVDSQTVDAPLDMTINLECDEALNVYASMTDYNNPGNTGTVLGLTPSANTASGIGVRFIKDGTDLISYGPSLGFVTSAPNQWRVKTELQPSNFSFRLKPQYIKTGLISAGQADATASITFAYD